MHVAIKVAVGCELPHPWYVPRIVVQGAGNLLLKLGLRAGGDHLLREIQWTLRQREWLQRRRRHPEQSTPHQRPVTLHQGGSWSKRSTM